MVEDAVLAGVTGIRKLVDGEFPPLWVMVISAIILYLPLSWLAKKWLQGGKRFEDTIVKQARIVRRKRSKET